MNKSIYDFKRKYAVQDELLNEGALDGLDERTLLYESPSFKEICSLINETIDDFIENAEEYIENVKERDLYEQFVSCREQYRKSRCICKLRNRRINNNSKPM